LAEKHEITLGVLERILIFGNMLLFMWLAISAGGLAVNLIRTKIWIPVSAEVIWKGDKCEIQSNERKPRAGDNYWLKNFVVDCADAQRVLKEDEFVQSNQRWEWRVVPAPYAMVSFEGGGKTHELLLTQPEVSSQPFETGDTVRMYHRKNDYDAIIHPFTGDELRNRILNALLSLSCFSVGVWTTFRYYARQVNEITRRGSRNPA
jgi:hypothetical protein